MDTPVKQAEHTITADMLEGLPPPVQRYMKFSGVVGKPRIDTVHITYTGKFRMALDKPWMPMTASQFYTTNPPGFLWKARFKIAGVPMLFATDTFKTGHSHMHGTLFGLYTVVDGSGAEVDQGTMVRYLQEMVWFPAAYLGDNITWQAVDDHSADVTLCDSGKSVTARMYFDDCGRMLTFIAQRYGDFNGAYAVRTWAAPMTEYGMFDGLQIPTSGTGVWQLPEGDLSYITLRLKAVEYNCPVDPF